MQTDPLAPADLAARLRKTKWPKHLMAMPMLLRLVWSKVLFPAPHIDAGPIDRRFWAYLAVLATVAGALLFPRLGYPLFEPDEARRAEIGREIVAGGEWLAPTLNFEPYFDKPPLLHWLIAGNFRLFGVNEVAARLVSAAAAFATVIAVFLLGRLIVGLRPAFFAGLALCLSIGFIQCGRFVIFDGVLTLFLTLSLFSAYLAIHTDRFRWRWWIASSICCALALITKGPVAYVLMAPPVAAHVWLSRNHVRIGLWRWFVHAGLALALVTPWYVAVTLKNPDFAYDFFINHHLKRFLGGDYHDGPVWFYIPVLIVGGMPWTLLLPRLARFLFTRNPEVAARRPQALGFFLLWAAWCFVFFSISRGKLPTYIVPTVPAFAMLVGVYLDRVLDATTLTSFFRASRLLAGAQGAFTSACAWGVLVIVSWCMGFIATAEMILELALAAAAMFAFLFFWRKIPLRVTWACYGVIGFILIADVVQDFVPNLAARRAPLHQADDIRAFLAATDLPVLRCYREWNSVPFYTQRNDIHGFYHMGKDDIAKYLQLSPRTLVVIRDAGEIDKLRELVPADKTLSLVAETSRVVLVVVERRSLSMGSDAVGSK